MSDTYEVQTVSKDGGSANVVQGIRTWERASEIAQQKSKDGGTSRIGLGGRVIETWVNGKKVRR